MNTPITVYVTVKDQEEARRIAQHVVGKRLAACANILPVIDSWCWWEGELREDREVAMILKTESRLFEALEAAIREVHSYEVPCIVAWPIAHGHRPYLEWIAAETRKP